MYKIYDNWPQIAQEEYDANLEPVNFDEVRHIVFSGMGGSGAISDIFLSILSKTNIHVEVVKGYLLPKTVDSKSVVVTTSISGNTEETLSILDGAIKSKCKIVAFSDGGKMEKLCMENKIEHRKILMRHSPRASFPAFLFSMLRVLKPIIPIFEEDIQESIKNMHMTKIKIDSNNLSYENPALSLAYWMKKIPIIYYPWGLQAAAIRFKNSLQENAKTHVINEDVIEASHNGIVGWDMPSIVQPILLEGKDDYIKTKQRWEIIKQYFQIKKIDFKEIHSENGSILNKLINLIYMLDYSSIYKAVLLGIDPTPVESIDFIKEKLST